MNSTGNLYISFFSYIHLNSTLRLNATVLIVGGSVDNTLGDPHCFAMHCKVVAMWRQTGYSRMEHSSVPSNLHYDLREKIFVVSALLQRSTVQGYSSRNEPGMHSEPIFRTLRRSNDHRRVLLVEKQAQKWSMSVCCLALGRANRLVTVVEDKGKFFILLLPRWEAHPPHCLTSPSHSSCARHHFFSEICL
jgi:hypothetical protein